MKKVKSGKLISDWHRNIIQTRTPRAGYAWRPSLDFYNSVRRVMQPDVWMIFQDMFEKVNKAYEFLCTKSTKFLDGPDPENIILILKTQSILFNRHKQGNLHVLIWSFTFHPLTASLSLIRAGTLQIRRLPHAHQNHHNGNRGHSALLQNLPPPPGCCWISIPHRQLLSSECWGAASGQRHRGRGSEQRPSLH